MAPKSMTENASGRPQPRRRVQEAAPANQLEIAIGQQVRAFRKQLHMTVAEVAGQAGLSPGMLSKIENGLTSPSLATLKALSAPVTSTSFSGIPWASRSSSSRI
jgi:DNA-binding XRE family transcriptional regulator